MPERHIGRFDGRSWIKNTNAVVPRQNRIGFTSGLQYCGSADRNIGDWNGLICLKLTLSWCMNLDNKIKFWYLHWLQLFAARILKFLDFSRNYRRLWNRFSPECDSRDHYHQISDHIFDMVRASMPVSASIEHSSLSMHFTPSRLYPSRQSHSKLPSLSLQSALTSQLCRFSTH